jgi:hypothetical protein
MLQHFLGEFLSFGDKKKFNANRYKDFNEKICQNCQILWNFFPEIAIFRQ